MRADRPAAVGALWDPVGQSRFGNRHADPLKTSPHKAAISARPWQSACACGRRHRSKPSSRRSLRALPMPERSARAELHRTTRSAGGGHLPVASERGAQLHVLAAQASDLGPQPVGLGAQLRVLEGSMILAKRFQHEHNVAPVTAVFIGRRHDSEMRRNYVSGSLRGNPAARSGGPRMSSRHDVPTFGLRMTSTSTNPHAAR